MLKNIILILFIMLFLTHCTYESEESAIGKNSDGNMNYVSLDSLSFIPDKLIHAVGTAPEGMSDLEALERALIMRDTICFTSKKKEEVEKDSITYSKFGFGIYYDLFKFLKNPKFEKTIIATKEFEERMKVIQKQGIESETILLIYLNNLDLNLWEIDSTVYGLRIEKKRFDASVFYTFSKQKKTTVKGGQKLSNRFIRKHYNNIIKQRELNSLHY